MHFLQMCMEIAAELEAECFTFWSGASDTASAPDVWERLRDGTAEVVQRCARYGLVPAFGPEPEMMIGTVAHWRRLADDVPGLRLALDTGHCLVTRDIEPPGRDPVARGGHRRPSLSRTCGAACTGICRSARATWTCPPCWTR